jgi:hypothetical protein
MKFLKITLLLSLLSPFLHGHPIPDIPVVGKFNSDGNCSIYIEIDTRSFAEDPEQVPFLTSSDFKKLSDSNKTDLTLQAKKMVADALQIRFGNRDWYLPKFKFDFVELDGKDLSEENIFVLQGKYDIFLERNANFYQIRSLVRAPYDLVFTNQINGKPQRRVNVLFPDEESFKFDLTFIDGKPIAQKKVEQKSGSTAGNITQVSNSIAEKSSVERREDARSTFYSFARQGFVHVLPLGLDHILFVLGLFFLSRKWKPILYQVSVFTVAHTITLGLATLELISAPSHVVEPIIAASIAVVALENIFFPNYRHSRLFIVFFFGLIHGLGFAGALSAFDLDPASLVIGLLGFNLGVEFGQLAVIAIAFFLTFWLKDEEKYRKIAVVPCSTLIALMGTYWTIERIFF